MSTYVSFGPKGLTASQQPEAPTTGMMQFAFINMGQGDCTMISCPDNKLYVVDCGSAAWLNDHAFAAAQILVRDWADGKSVYMVMTHPDKDHYNKYIDLLVSEPKVPVSVIYFSRALADTSPLGNYTQTALGANLYFFAYPMLKELTLNKTSHQEKWWANFFHSYQKCMGPYDIPATGYVLASGVTPITNIPWSLTVIAGNVKATLNTDSEITNAASLCTLAKYGDSTLLLTGDSNADTLKYLYDDHSGQIKDVTIFQVPHHGSTTGTPTTAFKNLVDPESLVVSVGLMCNTFNLPRYSVVDNWKNATHLQAIGRVMDYWKTNAEAGPYSDEQLNYILTNTWGTTYPWTNNEKKTFFWLLDAANGKKSGTGFYGFTNDGFFLYRDNWNKDIWMTGILGSSDREFEPALGAVMPPLPPPTRKPYKEKRP